MFVLTCKSAPLLAYKKLDTALFPNHSSVKEIQKLDFQPVLPFVWYS